MEHILNLAFSKGWNGQKTFDETEPNNAEADYVILTQVYRWLQQHGIYISTMPYYYIHSTGPIIKFTYYIHDPYNYQNPKTGYGLESHDAAFAAALEAAIKLLPDGQQEISK